MKKNVLIVALILMLSAECINLLATEDGRLKVLVDESRDEIYLGCLSIISTYFVYHDVIEFRFLKTFITRNP